MKALIFKHASALLVLAVSVVATAHAAEEFSSARIRILEITPPSGATIDEYSVIRARLSYEIEDFKSDAGRYVATALFDSTTPNRFVMVSQKVGDRFAGQSKIGNSAGELQINYPISMISNRRDIAVPMRVQFVINEIYEYEDEKQAKFFKDFFEDNKRPMFFKKSRTIGRTTKVTYVTNFPRESQPPVKPDQKGPYQNNENFSVVPAEPSIVIDKVAVNPASVSAGSRFEILAEYTVTDPSTDKTHVPVFFFYAIYADGQTLYEKGPVEAKSVNGKPMRRFQPMRASRKSGTYRIEVRISYGAKTTAHSASFQISGQDAPSKKDVADSVLLRETE